MGSAPSRILFSPELFDTSRFSFSLSEIEELRSPYATSSDKLDALYAFGVEGEDSLDTNIVGAYLSYIESFAGTFSSYGDTHTLIVLDTLFVPLFDSDRYTNCVTSFEVGDIFGFYLSLLEALDISVFHFSTFAFRYRSGRKYFVRDKAICFLIAAILL